MLNQWENLHMFSSIGRSNIKFWQHARHLQWKIGALFDYLKHHIRILKGNFHAVWCYQNGNGAQLNSQTKMFKVRT